MQYQISDLPTILPTAQWLQNDLPDATFEQLVIDSRKATFPNESLFFALTNGNNNGHLYLQNAYDVGIRCFVVSEKVDVSLLPETNILLVDDTLAALQDLAIFHRNRFPNLEVIGITGSNGKTIVKEWLGTFLEKRQSVVRSPKSYNSQIGVALSVWQIEEHHTLAIFEAGISQPQEMQRLAEMIQPTIGIFTNLGDAHDAGFSDKSQKAAEKSLLFNHEKLKTIICPDDDLILKSVDIYNKKIIRWSFQDEKADIFVESTTPINKIIKGILGKKRLPFELPLEYADAASVQNAVICLATLLQLGYPLSEIVFLGQKMKSVAMRLELKAGINGCVVVNDAYSADLNSLEIALDFLRQQAQQLPKTLILSDFQQINNNSEALYKKIGSLIKQKKITRFIGIGQEIQVLIPFLEKNNIHFQFFEDAELWLQNVRNEDFRQEAILVKGARLFGLERIVERLAQKAHNTVLEINLDALLFNYNVFKGLLKDKKTKIMVMVKAAAYGNGSNEVASLLQYHHVDYLGVAYIDEGIALRQNDIHTPIMVLNPDAASFEVMQRYGLEPEIYNLTLLRSLLIYAQSNKKSTRKQDKSEKWKIHLKMDTGMHRLGFGAGDMSEMLEILAELKEYITVASVFSHLASSENPDHDAFTTLQYERFIGFYEKTITVLGYEPLRHLVNSNGIYRFPQYQMEMVRLGIGLYGVENSGKLPLAVVQTLKATISQIKQIPKGETIGYSRRGIATEDMRIGTISIGYADGLLRGAGNSRFSVYLHQKYAPIIGSVCMDMCMIDLSDIPEAQEGDTVEIFGTQNPVQRLAEALNTIPYEVFTNVSERVKRVYFSE